MAHIQKSRLDRLLRHGSKKLRLVVKGLSPQKLYGRFNGPKILSNSIPKSGTHLLEVVLEQLPAIRNAGTKTLSEGAISDTRVILNRLRKISKGAFYNAHLPSRKEYIDYLLANDIKVVFLVRDPRDIAVSRYKYVTEIDMLHPAHKYFLEAENDRQRLNMAITGVPGAMPPLAQVFKDFSAWIGQDNVYTCRFEDLRGEAGGGDRGRQKKVIEEIIYHVGISLSDIDADALIKRAFSVNSSTFRKGKIGGWQDEFDDSSTQLLRREFGDIADSYGYDLTSG